MAASILPLAYRIRLRLLLGLLCFFSFLALIVSFFGTVILNVAKVLIAQPALLAVVVCLIWYLYARKSKKIHENVDPVATPSPLADKLRREQENIKDANWH